MNMNTILIQHYIRATVLVGGGSQIGGSCCFFLQLVVRGNHLLGGKIVLLQSLDNGPRSTRRYCYLTQVSDFRFLEKTFFQCQLAIIGE